MENIYNRQIIMNSQTIRINKGDTTVIQEAIEGLESLDGFDATLYVFDRAGREILSVDGEKEGALVTYSLSYELTKELPVGFHDFETKLTSVEKVFTPSRGKFIIDRVLKID